MRIAIDFDGTIADTYPAQQWFCKQNYKINLPLAASTGALRKQFLTNEQIKKSKAYQQQEGTLTAPLVKGAREAIQTLIFEGHKIIILTGRVSTGAKYAKEYLKRNKIPYHHFLFVSDDEKRVLKDGTALSKSVVLNRLKFDVMIDDQLKGLKAISANGIIVILIDQPWNRHEGTPTNAIRIKGWKSILDLLLTPVNV